MGMTGDHVSDNDLDPADSPAADAEAIRRLLDRRELASRRIRIALGRQLGLSDPEMLALAFLEDQGELTPSRLGVLLDLSSGGITALLQRLEREGYVARGPHPTDRRSYVIRPTAEAVRHGAEAIAPVALQVDALLTSLDADHRRVIREFLGRVAVATAQQASRMWRERVDVDDEPRRAVPSLWA
jgi:DNA-binding MarR family transcriptional regulator